MDMAAAARYVLTLSCVEVSENPSHIAVVFQNMVVLIFRAGVAIGAAKGLGV